MTRSGTQSGQAAVDYLAIVGVVAVILAGLVALGDGRTSRRPPINPFPVLAEPVTPPPTPRVRRSRVRAPTPRIDRRPVVTAPRWALP